MTRDEKIAEAKRAEGSADVEGLGSCLVDMSRRALRAGGY